MRAMARCTSVKFAMNPIVLIAAAVILIASITFAYMSSKTWHVGHVVIVVLTCLSSLGFVFLAANVLRVHDTHRTEVGRLTKDLDDERQRNDRLLNGDDGAETMGIRQLQPALKDETRQRGRVWRGCRIQDSPDAAGSVLVVSPIPLQPDSVVFAFEQGEARGETPQDLRYLRFYVGQFQVSATAGQTRLTPITVTTRQVIRSAVNRAQQFEFAWDLYDIMPVDRHDLFADLNDEDLKGLFPPAIKEEEYAHYGLHDKEPEESLDVDDSLLTVIGYHEDGTWTPLADFPAEETPQERRYVRRIQDYELSLQQLNRLKAETQNALDQVLADVKRFQTALAQTKQDQEARSAERQKLQQELQGFQRERAAVEDLLTRMEVQDGNLQARMQRVRERILQLTEQLRSLQVNASPLNARSRAGGSAFTTP